MNKKLFGAALAVLFLCVQFAPYATLAQTPTNPSTPVLPPAPVLAPRLPAGSITTAAVQSLNNSPITIIAGVQVLNVGLLSNGTQNYSGNLIITGTLYAVSTNKAVTTATFNALNIFNSSGAILTTVLPTGGLPGYSNLVSGLHLVLNAQQSIYNAGTISSAGNLTLTATTGSIVNAPMAGIAGTMPVIQAMKTLNLNAANIVNAGMLASLKDNVNINAAISQSLVFNNVSGTVQALSGQINISNVSITDPINTTVVGGNFLSQSLNIYSGTGISYTDVDQISGVLNVSAGTAQINCNSSLMMGNLTLSNDPPPGMPDDPYGYVFIQSNGNLIIEQSPVVPADAAPGASLTVDYSSGGSITNAGATEIITNASYVNFVAEGNINLSGITVINTTRTSGTPTIFDQQSVTIESLEGNVTMSGPTITTGGAPVLITAAANFNFGGNNTPAVGNVSLGNIQINTSNPTGFKSLVNGAGNGGNVYIIANNGSVSMASSANIVTGGVIPGGGVAGNVTVSTNNLSIVLATGQYPNGVVENIGQVANIVVGSVDTTAITTGTGGGDISIYNGSSTTGNIKINTLSASGSNITVNSVGDVSISAINMTTSGTGAGTVVVEGSASTAPNAPSTGTFAIGKITISGQSGGAVGLSTGSNTGSFSVSTNVVINTALGGGNISIFANGPLSVSGTYTASAGTIAVDSNTSLSVKGKFDTTDSNAQASPQTGSVSFSAPTGSIGATTITSNYAIGISGLAVAGNLTATTAPGGLISFSDVNMSSGSVKATAPSGTITVNSDGNLLLLSSKFDASGATTGASGGSVDFTAAGDLTISAGVINVAGGANGNGGSIVLTAGANPALNTAQISVAGTLTANGNGTGTGGNITISALGPTGSLTLGAGQIQMVAKGANGGSVTVQAGNSLTVNSGAIDVTPTNGNGGTITLDAGQAGVGGTLTINADLTASGTNNGNGGSIVLDPAGTVGGGGGGGSGPPPVAVNTFINGNLIANAGTNGTGGTITISNSVAGSSVTFGNTSPTKEIQVLGGTQTGNGGNISVVAQGPVAFTVTQISANARGNGNGGNITIDPAGTVGGGGGGGSGSGGGGTPPPPTSVALVGNVTANSGTDGGNGGTILITSGGNINADGGTVTAKALPGSGNGGTVTMQAGLVGGGSLEVSSTVNVDAESNGNGGTIALTTAAGSGGSVTIGATLSAVSKGTGTSGTINITADGAGSISQTGGMFSAGTVNLTSGTGNIGTLAQNIVTDTDNLSANTGGSGTVYISQSTKGLNVQTSTAGGTFQIDAPPDFIDVKGTIQANNVILEVAGAVILEASVTATEDILVTTTKDGSVTQTNGVLTANNIVFTSDTGSIGLRGLPVLTSANTLQANSGGITSSVFLSNNQAVVLLQSTAAQDFELTAMGDTTVAGTVTAGGDITVQTAAASGTTGNIFVNSEITASRTITLTSSQNGNILFDASITATTTATVTANGSGNITQIVGVLSAATLNLLSTTGNIGISGAPITVSSVNGDGTLSLSANTSLGGTGGVYLVSNSSVNLKAPNNSPVGTAGQTFSLLGLHDITVSGQMNAVDIALTTAPQSGGNITIDPNGSSANFSITGTNSITFTADGSGNIAETANLSVGTGSNFGPASGLLISPTVTLVSGKGNIGTAASAILTSAGTLSANTSIKPSAGTGDGGGFGGGSGSGSGGTGTGAPSSGNGTVYILQNKSVTLNQSNAGGTFSLIATGTLTLAGQTTSSSTIFQSPAATLAAKQIILDTINPVLASDPGNTINLSNALVTATTSLTLAGSNIIQAAQTGTTSQSGGGSTTNPGGGAQPLPNGLLMSKTMSLTAITGSIGSLSTPLVVQTSLAIFQATGDVGINNTGTGKLSILGSGGQVQITNLGQIAVIKPVSATSITIQTLARNSNIGIMANITAASFIAIIANGSGTISDQSGTLTAQSVNLISGIGNIGTSSAHILTDTGILAANTGGTGSSFVTNGQDVILDNSSAGKTFTLVNSGSINISGTLTATTINLSASGAGNITMGSEGAVIQGSTVTLSSGSGSLGSASNALQLTASTLTVQTGGTGSVYLSDSTALKLQTSSAGGAFMAESVGGLSVSNISAGNGSLTLISDGGVLSLKAGSLTANGGPLLIQNTNSVTGKITFAKNVNITSTGTSAGVSIVVGALPSQLTNTQTPTHIQSQVSNSGAIYYGANSIKAMGQNNDITTNGATVVFSTGAEPSSAITLGGAVNIDANLQSVGFTSAGDSALIVDTGDVFIEDDDMLSQK